MPRIKSPLSCEFRLVLSLLGQREDVLHERSMCQLVQYWVVAQGMPQCLQLVSSALQVVDDLYISKWLDAHRLVQGDPGWQGHVLLAPTAGDQGDWSLL